MNYRFSLKLGIILAIAVASAAVLVSIFFEELSVLAHALEGVVVLILLWLGFLGISSSRLNERLENQRKALLSFAKSQDIYGGDLDLALRELVSTSVKVLDVNRGSVWTFSEDYSKATCRMLFETDGDKFGSGYEISRKDFPVLFSTLLQERILTFSAIKDPDFLKELREASGVEIRSLLHTNVHLNGKLKAVLTFADTRTNRRWPTDQQNFANSVADMLAVAMSANEETRIRSELREKSTAIESALDGIGILNSSGLFTFVNKAFVEMYGFTRPNELQGKSWRRLYGEQELKRFENYLIPGFQEDGLLNVEALGLRKDGSTFPQELSLTSLPNGGWVVVTRDITRRKRVERNAEKIALFATLNPSPVLRIGADRKIHLANPAAIEILGLSQQQSGEQRGQQDLSHFMQEIEEIDLGECIRQGELRTFTARIRNERYKFNLKGVPYLGVAHLYGTEITDLKQRERELNESKSFLKEVINANPNMIFVKDQEGYFKLMNQAAAGIFGRSVDELLTMRDREFVQSDEALQRMMTEDREVIQKMTDKSILEEEFIDPQGNRRWLQTVKRPIRFVGSDKPHILGVATDVTEQKHLREKLVQSSKLEAIGQLAGGIAHDFNNLLTGIFGYTNLLKEIRKEDSQVSEAAEMIEVAASRASQLTEKLLGFARKGKHRNVPLDINDCIDEIYGLISRTVEKNIHIHREMDASSSMIKGDPTQMNQVFLNLALNARDSMTASRGGLAGGGKLTFRSRIVSIGESRSSQLKELKRGRYLEVSVIDTGCGIKPELREKIFEPFFTTKAEGKGTGMGLAMVYGIVKNHGGTITLESALGEGSHFRVYLPLADEMGSSAESETDSAKSSFLGQGNILLVDDHSIVRDVASRMLITLGYDVVTAKDGIEALEYYQTHCDEIDLVILDLVMPRMGARECLKKIRKVNPDVRVILSTGYVNNNAVEEILAEGTNGFVQKPYKIGQLSQAVSKALSNDPGRGGSTKKAA